MTRLIYAQFIERGLPVPQYLQGVSSSYIDAPQAPVESNATDDVAMTDAPIPVSLLFTTYDSVSDISYTPEASFKEGLGMVKTIRTNIEKLRTGSKLRQDVWTRELNRKVKFAFFYSSCLWSRSLEGQTSPKTLIAVCGGSIFCPFHSLAHVDFRYGDRKKHATQCGSRWLVHLPSHL